MPLIAGQQQKPTKQETVESHFLTLSGHEHAQFRALRHRSFIMPRMSRHTSAIGKAGTLGEIRRKVVKVRETQDSRLKWFI